jgi:outer membrane receptor protein involved in Fe transport
VRVTPVLGLYANVSRGFRSTDGVIEDPALAPITAWAYEGGVKLDRGGVTGTAALFRMDVSNEQTINPVTLEPTSGGASRRQGLELTWRAPLGPTTLSGDWTFNDARYRHLTIGSEDGDEPPAVVDGLRVYNTSKYVGAVALDVPLGARTGARARSAPTWRLRASGTFNGPYSPFDEPGVVLGGWALFHVSGAVRVRDVEVDAGVRNLFDRRYPELVAGHIVSPGEPRAVDVTVRVTP